MENIELLQSKVREYDPESDRHLPVFSYSKLDVSTTCPMQYDLKYNQKNYAPADSIPLSAGTLAHKVLELKARAIMRGEEVDYEFLSNVLADGIEEETDKATEMIQGSKYIKSHFGFEQWFEPDNASGMNYDEKFKKFESEVVPDRMTDGSDWKPVGAEVAFDFCYNYGTEDEPKWVHIHGFIDSVMENSTGEYKMVDYKTSKKIYPPAKTTTSLQMFIYGLAWLVMTDTLPSVYEYDFIFINQKQQANTPGYAKRGIKKLDKIFQSLDDNATQCEWKPKPCPLCYWCSYSGSNPDGVEPFNSLCPYYSLWTPTQKTFAVNQQYAASESPVTQNKKSGRKLVF